MGNLFVAINGDNVGERLGQAIASDNHEELASATEAINGAHASVDEWVQDIGGRKITGSGDEAIYLIPEEAAQDLEHVKDLYSKDSGHTMTIGVGSSMSEATKAMIYGKLSGKDQIVEYEPAIEDYLSEDEEAQEAVDQDPLEEEIQPEMEDEGELEDEAVLGEATQEADVSDDVVDDDEDGLDDLKEQDLRVPAEDDQADEEQFEEDGDELSDEEEELQNDEIVEDAGLDSDEPNSDDELADVIESQMDEGVEDSEQVPEEEMMEEEIQPEMEDEQAIPEEGLEEESGDDEDSELKNDIAQALLSFKQNKELLEAAREQNPELYQANITMLRAMIQMAKKLGYSPEQDMGAMEETAQMEEEFPPAEPEMEQPVEEQAPPEMEEGEEEDQPGKK